MNNLRVLRDQEIEMSEWVSFFSGNQFATPFQSPAYYNFFNSTKNYSAHVYAVYENSLIHAMCVLTIQKESGIKGYFSKRSIIYGGPLVTSEEIGAEALKILLVYINEAVKNITIYTEVRNLHDYKAYKGIFEANGWLYLQHLNFHLDCSSEHIVWSNLNNNRKRQIKKAIKVGVKIDDSANLAEILDFYNILFKLYNKKIKKPLPSFEYFKKLTENNLAKFLLIKLNNRVIGGIVCPVLEGRTVYELYICGLDQEYRDASPSVMATFAAIEYGYRNNFKRFDFLGAGKPNADYGVRDFKEKFGGVLVENGRFLKIQNSVLYNLGKFVLKIQQILLK